VATPREALEKEAGACRLVQKGEQELMGQLSRLWERVEELYLGGTEQVFGQLRSQREAITLRFAEVRQRFIQLLVRQDSKFHHIKEYQLTFNRMLDEWFDMCEEDFTKEELHHRVEDLQDRLLAIIDAKQEEASEERKNIAKSGWIEAEMERLYLLVMTLVQSELHYYFGSQQIITDYFLSKDGRDKEAQAQPALEFQVD
jgi:hypothetical protein